MNKPTTERLLELKFQLPTAWATQRPPEDRVASLNNLHNDYWTLLVHRQYAQEIADTLESGSDNNS